MSTQTGAVAARFPEPSSEPGRGGERLLEDHPLGPALLAGQRGDILELGHHLQHDAVARADLDAYPASADGYLDELAIQGDPAAPAVANAQGAGVAEDPVSSGIGEVLPAEDAQGVCGAALLHQD